MGRKLVIFADGTGNAFSTQESNVWRLYQALDQSRPDQIARYIKGVGTSGFRPFAMLDAATGVGVPSNVRELYRFLCWNWRPGDEIYMFGFSRGSFTIRALVGLIALQGLVPATVGAQPVSKAEMARNAMAAWRAYRAGRHQDGRGGHRWMGDGDRSRTETAPGPTRWRFPTIALARGLRDGLLGLYHTALRHRSYASVRRDMRDHYPERHVIPIAFLGLFDTVEAYGVPFNELRAAIDFAIWPISFDNRRLSPIVRRACHALSLDDERTTFHPLLWDESPEKVATGTRPTSKERISQVWFAGVHSNVGGAYPDDSLAHVSLTWMLSEARQRGLTLKAAPGADPDAFTKVCSTQDKDGRIYDSRNGLAGYYRYGPRSVAALSNTEYSDDKRDCVHIAVPKIHQSVFERIAVDAHLYAPVSLPPAYEVLTYDERIVSPDNLRGETPEAAHRFESAASARGRDETQEKAVGSSIWRRRIIYFLTVIASIYLLAYPIASQLPPAAEYTTRLRPLSDVIRMAEVALPGAAKRWTNAYARDPMHFLLAAGMVALLMWLSSGLKDRITDQMRSAWRRSLSKYDVHADPQPAANGAGIVQNVIYACLLLIVLYPVPASLGFPLPKLVEPMQILVDRATEPYFRILAFVILVTMFLPDWTIAWFRLKDGYKQTISNFKLWIAPAFFALAFLVGGVALAGHYIFNVRDSFGAFCLPDPDAKPLEVCRQRDLEQCDRDDYGNFPATCKAACRGVETEFDTRRLCTSTKVKVSTNGRYHFEISAKDDWSFLGAKSGVGGALLPKKNETWGESTERWARTAMLAVGFPIKRTFDRPFGRVILRFGETGNEENFIDPSEDDLLANKLEETVKATREGELYVYLNKPVSGFWPGLFNDVNSGTAKIRVYRVQRATQ